MPKSNPKVRRVKEEPQYREFGFAYYENAQRVAMAFALANMPVTIKYDVNYTVKLHDCQPPKKTE